MPASVTDSNTELVWCYRDCSRPVPASRQVPGDSPPAANGSPSSTSTQVGHLTVTRTSTNPLAQLEEPETSIKLLVGAPTSNFTQFPGAGQLNLNLT
jgi:hypothetical protein